MRRKLILGGLTLAVIVAGVTALAAFTAQIVNITARVEKDIAVEPVICSNPGDINTPCFVDPRGGDFGVTLPQEFYDRVIEVTLSNSFFEQDRFFDLAFDVLWECKNVRDAVIEWNEVRNGVPTQPLCREDIADDSLCPVDLDGDGIPDTVKHCNPLKLDGPIRDHMTVNELLDARRCLVDEEAANHTPRPAEKKVQYVASGFLDKFSHKCRYELKFFAPPCIGSFNPFTDPHPLTPQKIPIDCHLADKDRDGNPDLRNPQDFDEFADLGDDFKIQVWAHSPTIEVDEFPDSVLTMTVLDQVSGQTFPVTATGPATVNVNLSAIDDLTTLVAPTNECDPENDGPNPGSNNKDEVPTEIVSMELTGLSPIGPFTVRLNPAIPSTGQIEEENNPVPGRLDLPPFAPFGAACSFFDVFVEIEVPGATFHNEEPLRIKSRITEKPPAVDDPDYCGENDIPLLLPNGDPSGFTIQAGHCHDPVPPPTIPIPG